MSKLIGVRFDKCGPIKYYTTGAANPVDGDHVIAETEMGIDLGRVVLDDCDPEKVKAPQPVRSIIRVAMERDLEKVADDREREKEAFDICNEKIAFRSLDMKLIRAKYMFDNKKVIFYFYSEDRVDFRELVKDLAAIFKMRIELRQIGVRDEAKMLGGIGACGRHMCCASCMPEFTPVSIKMAKDQSLSLNPTSISGICGRLMCCLGHENETYEYLHAKMPSVGDEVEITGEKQKGVIIGVNVLREMVKVLVNKDSDDRDVVECRVDDVTVTKKKATVAETAGDEDENYEE